MFSFFWKILRILRIINPFGRLIYIVVPNIFFRKWCRWKLRRNSEVQGFDISSTSKNEAREYCSLSGERILLVMPGHIAANKDLGNSYVPLMLQKSAEENNLEIQVFNADSLYASLYNDKVTAGEHEQELEKLHFEIARFRPTLLLFDGNMPFNDQTFFWKEILQVYKHQELFKIAVLVFDAWHNRVNKYLKMFRESDIIIWLTPDSLVLSKLPSEIFRKVCVNVFTPIPEEYQAKNFEKQIDFFFDGHNFRDRKWFLYKLNFRLKFLNVKINLNSRYSPEKVNFHTYMEFLMRSKVTFANGYINRKNCMVVDRVSDAILTHTVLIYEECKIIKKFLVPYIEYIPVKTSFGIQMWTDFFCYEVDIYDKFIATAAESFLQKFGAEKFWKHLIVHKKMENCNFSICSQTS